MVAFTSSSNTRGHGPVGGKHLHLCFSQQLLCCCSGQSSHGASSSSSSSSSSGISFIIWISESPHTESIIRVPSPMLEQKGTGVSYLGPNEFSPPLHHHDRHLQPGLVVVLRQQSKSDPSNSQGKVSKEGWWRRLSCTGSLLSAGPSCRRRMRCP